MSNVIILGSSRDNGNTAGLANHLATTINAEIVNLNNYRILPYDYAHKNQEDDFSGLIDHLITYKRLIFASPIYWYSPSATMKLFIDRLCDLTEIDKTRGRNLRLKSAAVISTGAAVEVDSCFEQIFRKTFDYFSIKYDGMLYCQCEDDYVKTYHKKAVDRFATQFRSGNDMRDVKSRMMLENN